MEEGRSGAAKLLAERRARLGRLLGRGFAPATGAATLPPPRREHLLQEATELYWNELSWEQVTAEERTVGTQRVERMFPGLLALVDGLLLGAGADRPPEASGRAAIVEAVLSFLADRVACDGAEDESDAPIAREITLRLMDLVLYRAHGLTAEEIERIEIARLMGDE